MGKIWTQQIALAEIFNYTRVFLILLRSNSKVSVFVTSSDAREMQTRVYVFAEERVERFVDIFWANVISVLM